MSPSMAIQPRNEIDATRRRKLATIFAIAFVLFLVFVSACSIIIFIAIPILSNANPHPCLSEGCIYQQLLTNSLDKRANPCDDFGSYVCSAIRPTGEILQWSLTYDPKHIWSKQKSDYLARSTFKDAPWMINAANVYESCVNRTGENERQNLADLVSFMRRLRLAWPQILEDRSHPLDVALELAILWEMPFWFKVRLLDKTTTKPRRIYVSHGTYTTYWVHQYKQLREPSTYMNYVENYLNMFSVNLTLNMTQVQRELEITRDVLTSLHYGAFRKRKNSTVLSIADLDGLLPAGEGTSWTYLLNKHFKQTPPFTANETVLLSDTEILEVIGRLLAKYGSDIMMYQLGWWFVQYYTVIASDVAFLLKFGDKMTADTLKPLFCEIQVEALHKWLLIADHVKSFVHNETNTVDNFLGNIIYAAISKIRESSWIDTDSQKTAIDKLSSISVNLWPEELPSIMVDGSALPPSTSYVKNWIHGHASRASLLGTKYYYETTRLPHNMRDPSFHYDYLLNEVTLAMVTIGKPFYILKDSSTMNFAGLGSAFARVLVKAFDPVGITHLRSGSPKPWLSPNISEEFVKRASCEEFDDSIFPEIPGLEVAFRAFRDDSRASGGRSVNRWGFHDREMFFIQYCRVMCLTNVTSLGQRCNLVLRNFKPFADAFRCAPGTRMNPKQKCTFF